MLGKVRPVESVQEWWEERSTTIFREGQGVLSITAGRRSPGDKETWWWNDNVQEVIKAEKDLTRFNKIAIQGTPQMAVDKEAICLS